MNTYVSKISFIFFFIQNKVFYWTFSKQLLALFVKCPVICPLPSQHTIATKQCKGMRTKYCYPFFRITYNFFLLYIKDISYHSFEFYNLHFDFVFLKMFNTVIKSAEYLITYFCIRFYWPHNKP